MFEQRKPLYAKLERSRASKVVVFVTSDRAGLQTQIADDVYDYFVNHLDKVGVVKKISLYLYTRGGFTAAAWAITNLLKSFCEELELIIPGKAHSGGTLMALAGKNIVMTKQATLGPIDPSINNPLNPQIPGQQPHEKAQVSVEAIKGYIELAKVELGLTEQAQLGQILTSISAGVHPLVLGDAYRVRSQIKMLAEKLLSEHIADPKAIKGLVNFLCSESGSHDYTIHRREAKKLGLKIEVPSVKLYALIKEIYEDISTELELKTRYDPLVFLGSEQQKNYSFHRGLVETIAGGSTVYVTEGQLSRVAIPTPPNVPPQTRLHDQRHYDGWKHYDL